MKLLVNITRAEQFIAPLVEQGLVDALLRLLDCSADTIRSSVLKLIGLLSVDESARRQILEGNLIPEMMNVVTGKDETFLVSVLPRLLRDERLALCFSQYGGIAFLQKTMTMGVSAQGVAGSIVGLSMLSQFPRLVKLMVDEEEFVSSLVMMLSYQGEGPDAPKLKVLLLKALYAIAAEPAGLKLVQESGPLPLMELIERAADTQQLAPVVAAFEVLNVLCADKDMRDEVDRLGAGDFVTQLFFYAASSNASVLEPLCRLLRALAQGENRVQIVEGLKEHQARRPEVTLFGETVTAILDGGRLSVAREIGGSMIDGQLPPDARPQRRLTKESATMRQGAKRIQVIREVVTTERTYTAALDKLVSAFALPLRENATKRGAAVTTAEVDVIFGNLPQVLEFHKTILKKLEALVKSNPSATLSGWFSELGDRLVDIYRPYFGRYRDSLAMLTKKMQSKTFAKLVAKLAKDAKEALMLESLLIMPIQRLPRYVLLIKELDRATVDVHPEKPILGSVAKKLDGKVSMLNDVTALPPTAAEAAPQGRFASLRMSTSPAAASGRGMTVNESSQPVLRDGVLREYLDEEGAPVPRKALLMKDKLVIMASSRSARTSSAPTLVHSFPLSSLRVDMLEDSFELVDLRDNEHNGPEFDTEDADMMHEWVNAILDAIFDCRYER